MSQKYTSATSKLRAEAAWSVAQRLQQFTYASISYEATVPLPHATMVVKAWEASGKVRRIAASLPGGEARITFEVIPKGEITVQPLVGDMFDQMWFSARKRRSFSPVDLLSTCSVAVTHEQAAAYCRALLAGGYLRVVQKAAPPHKVAIYRLCNETGIHAPRIRRLKCISDPNLGTSTPLVEGSL
jgi:hypothetical protein